MSKAILVIDKPKSCRNCPLFSCQLMRCNYTGNKLDIFGCPLKPMPEKLDAIEISLQLGEHEVDSRLIYQVDGYNKCIDEILGKDK